MAYLAACQASAAGGAVLWSLDSSTGPSVGPTVEIATGAPCHSVQWLAGKPIVALGSTDGVVQLHVLSAGAPPSYLGSLPTEANATVTPMGPVEAVRFSANNKMMTVGCSDGVVYTWDLKTQALAGAYRGHTSAITSIATSAEDVMASASADGSVQLHTITSSSTLAVLCSPNSTAAHSVPKRCLTFSPLEGGLLAGAADDGPVTLWSTMAGRQEQVKLGSRHTGWVTGIAFSPVSAPVLLTAGTDRLVVLWDRRRGGAGVEAQMVRLPSSLSSLGLREDGHSLAAGGTDGNVYLMDLRRLSEGPLMQLRTNRPDPVTEVGWQSHGRSSKSKTTSGSAPIVTVPQAAAATLGGSSTLPAGGAAAAQPPAAPAAPAAVGGSSASMVQAPAAAGAGAPAAAARSSSCSLQQPSAMPPAVPLPSTNGSGPATATSLGVASIAATGRGTAQGPSDSLSTWLPGSASQSHPQGHGMAQHTSAGTGLNPSLDTRGTSSSGLSGSATDISFAPPAHLQSTSSRHAGISVPGVPGSTGIAASTSLPLASAGTATAASGELKVPGAASSHAAGAASMHNAAAGGLRNGAAGAAGAAGVSSSNTSAAMAGVNASASAPAAAGGGSLVRGGVTEAIFRSVMEDMAASIREDMRNLHIEMIRQFHMQQLEMRALTEQVLAQQAELRGEMRGLKERLDHLARKQQLDMWLG